MDNTNTLLYILVTSNLRLKCYSRLYATIHFQTGNQDNILRKPLDVTILTQYHVSKGLKVFGESGVMEVLKDLKQIHDSMVMDPKIHSKCHVMKRSWRYNI